MQKRFTPPEEWVSGKFRNADGANIHYGFLARHQNPIANIIIPGGLSEFTEKYIETVCDLDQLGYNGYGMDWRGQGASDRYLSDYFKRHSLGFDRDERDLLQFIDQYVPDNAPRVILAHSMGGIPTLLAIRDYPDKIQAAILTAPLMGFIHSPARGRENWLAKVADIPFNRKLMESYIPNGGPWRKRSGSIERNGPEVYSSDPNRMRLHDEWMIHNPRLRIGDPTIGLIVHASRAILDLRRPDVLESMETPIQIFSAGQEKLVSNKAIFNAVAHLPNALHTHLTRAKHDLLMETDDLRTPVLEGINSFLRANL